MPYERGALWSPPRPFKFRPLGIFCDFRRVALNTPTYHSTQRVIRRTSSMCGPTMFYWAIAFPCHQSLEREARSVWQASRLQQSSGHRVLKCSLNESYDPPILESIFRHAAYSCGCGGIRANLKHSFNLISFLQMVSGTGDGFSWMGGTHGRTDCPTHNRGRQDNRTGDRMPRIRKCNVTKYISGVGCACSMLHDLQIPSPFC